MTAVWPGIGVCSLWAPRPATFPLQEGFLWNIMALLKDSRLYSLRPWNTPSGFRTWTH